MTVRELRELLMTVDDDFLVLEENKSEVRILHKEDVKAHHADPDHTWLTDDGEEVPADKGVVILGAWS